MKGGSGMGGERGRGMGGKKTEGGGWGAKV